MHVAREKFLKGMSVLLITAGLLIPMLCCAARRDGHLQLFETSGDGVLEELDVLLLDAKRRTDAQHVAIST